MLANWHIRSRARLCSLSGEPFAEGETIITALFPDPESSGYLRKDFSIASWESRGENDEAAFSFWRSIYEAPVHDEKEDPMKKEDPETLLRRLVEEDEEHTENARYILAVMLERQKLLRETDSQPLPSGILRVYEHRKTGEAFLVRDPNIPLDEVEKVQEDVIALLENGGRPPEPAETEEAETNSGTEADDDDDEPSEESPSESPAGA
jgi:hypothetical protein